MLLVKIVFIFFDYLFYTLLYHSRRNVTVHGYGFDNLPAQTGYIMYPNHQGLFDVMGLGRFEAATFKFARLITVFGTGAFRKD